MQVIYFFLVVAYFEEALPTFTRLAGVVGRTPIRPEYLSKKVFSPLSH
jgi:hypothetical protein